MIRMTKAKKENDTAMEIQELKTQNMLMTDRMNLTDKGYYRQQMLILLERIAMALEGSAGYNSNKKL